MNKFETLPPELRNHIYEIILNNISPTKLENGRPKIHVVLRHDRDLSADSWAHIYQSQPFLGLTQVNKRSRYEFRPLIEHLYIYYTRMSDLAMLLDVFAKQKAGAECNNIVPALLEVPIPMNGINVWPLCQALKRNPQIRIHPSFTKTTKAIDIAEKITILLTQQSSRLEPVSDLLEEITSVVISNGPVHPEDNTIKTINESIIPANSMDNSDHFSAEIWLRIVIRGSITPAEDVGRTWRLRFALEQRLATKVRLWVECQSDRHKSVFRIGTCRLCGKLETNCPCDEE